MIDNLWTRMVRKYGRRMVRPPKIQNNEFCFCGSKLKYKYCCKRKRGSEERRKKMYNKNL